MKACLQQLDPLPDGANLGFLYVTDALAGDLDAILVHLKQQTRITEWVGSVGLGICAVNADIFERPAIAVLTAALPADSYRVFAPIAQPPYAFDPETTAWIERRKPVLGVVHGDPRCADLDEAVAGVSTNSGSFLVGAFTSARQRPRQIADNLVEGGLSGVLLGPDVAVSTGLSQGCAPIGPVRRITEAAGNAIMAIDQRPALDVFREDIGELLSRDLHRAAGLLFAGFPMSGDHGAEYFIRNFFNFDVERKWLVVDHVVHPGDEIVFCRRDTPSAVSDLKRMLAEMKLRNPRPPQAGLYFSCIARGPNMFAPGSEELSLIRATLGDFPLVGFFGNGEISRDRRYWFTGVLAVFP